MRPRQANIPVDLTDVVESEVDFSQWDRFAAEVKQVLRDNGIDDSAISIPDTTQMVKINQKPELLRETLVQYGNDIRRLGRQNSV